MAELAVSGPHDGEPLWFLDTLMRVRRPAEAGAEGLSILEQLAPPGSATPLHRHDRTDEYFYVLGGEVTFYAGDASHRCEAGSLVSIPLGTMHAFRVTGDEPARLLVISSPAHFEEFVRAVSRPASTAALPPAAPPPDEAAMRQLSSVAAAHDTIILGPPPAVAS